MIIFLLFIQILQIFLIRGYTVSSRQIFSRSSSLFFFGKYFSFSEIFQDGNVYIFYSFSSKSQPRIICNVDDIYLRNKHSISKLIIVFPRKDLHQMHYRRPALHHARSLKRYLPLMLDVSFRRCDEPVITSHSHCHLHNVKFCSKFTKLIVLLIFYSIFQLLRSPCINSTLVERVTFYISFYYYLTKWNFEYLSVPG